MVDKPIGTWENHGKTRGKSWGRWENHWKTPENLWNIEVYPLVMTNIANWNITIFDGKIHYIYIYIYMVMFNSYVELPKGTGTRNIRSLMHVIHVAIHDSHRDLCSGCDL